MKMKWISVCYKFNFPSAQSELADNKVNFHQDDVNYLPVQKWTSQGD
jgi:hypothetical protein